MGMVSALVTRSEGSLLGMGVIGAFNPSITADDVSMVWTVNASRAAMGMGGAFTASHGTMVMALDLLIAAAEIDRIAVKDSNPVCTKVAHHAGATAIVWQGGRAENASQDRVGRRTEGRAVAK